MSKAIYETSTEQTNGGARGLDECRPSQTLAAGDSRLLATIEAQTTKEA